MEKWKRTTRKPKTVRGDSNGDIWFYKKVLHFGSKKQTIDERETMANVRNEAANLKKQLEAFKQLEKKRKLLTSTTGKDTSGLNEAHDGNSNIMTFNPNS